MKNKIDILNLNTIPSMMSILKKEYVSSCPLCKCKQYDVSTKIPINDIIISWMNKRKFNPIPTIYINEILEKRHCLNCSLYYYNYKLSDSVELYDMLSRSNYYPKFRAEYSIAIEQLKKHNPSSLLELGCGYGNFLASVYPTLTTAVGIESNPRAIALCKEKKVTVFHSTTSLPLKTFDIVCHFELLEHISDIDSFIKKNLKLLNSNGCLIIGTPNPDGILTVCEADILDLPPHHQYNFSKSTFNWIANKYNLKIIDYKTTLVDNYRYEMYKQNQQTPKTFDEICNMYNGDTHVVTFQKNN